MKLKNLLNQNTLGAAILNVVLVVSILFMIGILYFYVYLPNATNHGETITVPDLTGMRYEELETFVTEHELRFQVDDSAYSEDYPPLTVLRQFPKPGATVKENRMIYVSVNRINPPTVPLPDLANDARPSSRIGAEAILKSTGLKRGKILLMPHPHLNLVIEMRYQGKKIEANTRIPKGSVIDLVVGDGNGPSDFTLGNLIGDTYERALFKLSGWNLHIGNIEIPEGADTTGTVPYVKFQYPLAGDSVRVGDPIDLTIAPKDFDLPEDE